MPSGCVHGAKCAYSHAKAPPPKSKDGSSADAKAKAKSAPAAAILAATMLQPSQAGQIEWAADSGSGRHLTSFEALTEQGYDLSFFGFSNQSQESLRFSTGGGQKNSSMSISFHDRSGLFGKANHFILDSCPMVRSIGVDVDKNGLGFIRFHLASRPGSDPFYVRNPANCYVKCSEENKFYASKVVQNVQFFRTSFDVIPGVPAEAEPSSDDILMPEFHEEPVPDSSLSILLSPEFQVIRLQGLMSLEV